MRFPKFFPHENLPDIQVDESHFCTDSDVIDEPQLFQGVKSRVTTTLEDISSDTEESDHKNPHEIIIHLEPERLQSLTFDNSAHTTTLPQESQHDPAFHPKNQKDRNPNSSSPQTKKKTQDASNLEVT